MKVSDSLESFIAPDKATDPAIPEGAHLLCSTNMTPKNGDFVVFVPNEGASHFVRQYLVQQDGSVLLQAFNRSFDSYVSTTVELAAAGRIVPILRVEYELPAAVRIGGAPSIGKPQFVKAVKPPQVQEPVAPAPVAVASSVQELPPPAQVQAPVAAPAPAPVAELAEEVFVKAAPAPVAPEPVAAAAPVASAPAVAPEPAVAAPAAPASEVEGDLLTFDEAKAALKVQRTKMYALLRSGELKAMKVGKLWRVERSSIIDYLKRSAFKGLV